MPHYFKEIIDNTPELDGLHISCRSSLYRRMGITTKRRVVELLSNGLLAPNNGQMWGQRRHQKLLDWLRPNPEAQ